VERWLVAFIIVLIVSAVSAAIICAVLYYGFPPSEQYYLDVQHQFTAPPMTSTTAPFTITGKEWYVDWTYASYTLVPSSLDVWVRNASTDAPVEHVTLTNEQHTAHFDVQGRFYLSITLNNATNVEQRLLLVDIWELR
jgi:hypothetical protein